MNLEALIHLAHLGDRLGVNLWSFRSEKGGSIRRAIDFLIPSALGKEEWKWKQIVAPEYERMIPILRIAAKRFNDSSYDVVADAVQRHIGTSPQPNFSMPLD